jgi:hypothetical protein
MNDNDLIKKLWLGVSEREKDTFLKIDGSELNNVREKYNLALKNKINSNSGLDNIYNKINADLTKF